MGKAPLIADADRDFTSQIVTDRLGLDHMPMLANDLATAQYALERDGEHISCVILNPNIGKVPLKALVEIAKKETPQAPIFLLCDSLTMLKAFESLVAQFPPGMTLVKPMGYREMVDSYLIKTSSRTAKPRPLSGFLPVPSEAFIGDRKVETDVWVQSTTGELIKILFSGDIFESARLRRYISSGADFFFVKSEVVASNTQAVINEAQECVEFLKTAGVTERSIAQAKEFATHAAAVAQHYDFSEAPQIKKLLLDLLKGEHAAATAMIGSLLLKPLGINNAEGIEIVSVASLIHDLALDDPGNVLWLKEDSELTDAERRSYQQHPLVGAQLLSFIPNVDPMVAKAVEQHHERQTKKGFPAQLGSGEINPFAEVVGIADEFLRLIEKTRKGMLKGNPFELLEKTLATDFNPTHANAFRKVFRR